MALRLNCKKIISRFILKNPFTRNNSTLSVRIVEVGPRDGLQNEPTRVDTDVKIEFINKLSQTGLRTIEVTSFVSPKWVPQMGDNLEVFSGIDKQTGVTYPVLVPNVQGCKSALKAGAEEVAIFIAASEGFSRKNTNCTIQESLNRTKEVIDLAHENNTKVRGYVSCVVGCPYDGKVPPASVAKLTESLLSLGCYEISLGDTIGVGTKSSVTAMLEEVLKVTSPDKIAIHCHDTYGQGLVNILVALDKGVTVVDSAVAGLGGCPYARGATGNVATEDLVYMLEGMGVRTGVNLKELIKAGRYISDFIKKPPASRVNNALYSKLS
ncbi:unnamed protein product [Phyllotreta striolata]|uniref:hydroxymethylglutaryl-CoA lyase n=1 Tax=Phyllotreta striolata TaxID=444603 RepID=A0A9N9XMW9_PHYSR|nr:unnamed protein product [Phyllotreta striolata]